MVTPRGEGNVATQIHTYHMNELKCLSLHDSVKSQKTQSKPLIHNTRHTYSDSNYQHALRGEERESSVDAK